MNNKLLLSALVLCHFYLTQCMETTPSQITDVALQKLITAVNKDSLQVVNLVKKHTQNDYKIEVIPKNMPLIFELDKQQINDLFLDNVNDNDLRPMLLKMGANTKACGEKNRNCLWRVKNPVILRELIAAEAVVDHIDDDKKTPLVELLYWGIGDDETIEGAEVLLEHQANPNIELDFWGSILHRVVEIKDSVRRFKAAQLLCKYGANVNTHNKHNHTPVYQAIKEGDENLVELFLPKLTPDEINAPNYYQEALLHIAMEQDHGLHYYNNQVRKIIPKIVLLLLQYKANPNMAYRDGKTRPLHVAVERNQPEIIQKLVEYGARKDFTDPYGKTAYMIAKQRGYKQDILDLLYTNTIFKDDEGDDVIVVENQRNPDETNVEIEGTSTSSSCILQ